ncbi:MAG: choice-of-anchor D domain-containing protein [Verrucomicrobiota bacterium]
MAVGDSHSLFLKSNGTVWACGFNVVGQLGDGTNTTRLTAVQASGLTGITAMEGGYYHSLFLKSDGTVRACGWNTYGQLGDGTDTNRTTPVQTITAIMSEINLKGNNNTIVDGDNTPSTVDHTNFSNVVINMSPTRTYTIENTGGGNLLISSITSNNALFAIGPITPAGPIAPGNSATFTVTFSPINTGVKNGIITINNNDCDEGVYTYDIRGTASVATCPTLTFNESHVNACSR